MMMPPPVLEEERIQVRGRLMQGQPAVRVANASRSTLGAARIQDIARSHAVDRMNGSVFSGLPQGSRMGTAPGRVPIVGGLGFRGGFIGQEGRPIEDQPPRETPEMTEDSRSRRMAWGRLKKLEAEELLAELKLIEERMRSRQMPAGIVAQIADRIEAFVQTAPKDAEFTMSEDEVNELDTAILALEAEEKASTTGTATLVVLGALGVTALAIFG